MKRDMDLIRDLLLRIEDASEEPNSSAFIEECDETEKDRVTKHLRLLHEAGLIKGIISNLLRGRWRIQNIELTWQGHDFVGTVRDPEVWARTKETAQKAGTGAIELVWGIAKEVAKAEIKRRTGFDVG